MSFGEPTALIVDDDFMFVMHVSSVLSDAGLRVIEVPTPAQALTLLEPDGGHIALLFSDVQMPGKMDGFQLAREVNRRWPQIQIIVASGYEKPSPEEMPTDAAFMAKPVNFDDLRDFLTDRMPNLIPPRG